jgi:hypothetical protein
LLLVIQWTLDSLLYWLLHLLLLHLVLRGLLLLHLLLLHGLLHDELLLLLLHHLLLPLHLHLGRLLLMHLLLVDFHRLLLLLLHSLHVALHGRVLLLLNLGRLLEGGRHWEALPDHHHRLPTRPLTAGLLLHHIGWPNESLLSHHLLLLSRHHLH